jgi:hypothetical protein
MSTWQLSRSQALLALLILVGGLGLFAFSEGWVALDGDQAEKTAARLHLSFVLVVPGLAVGLIVWVLSLIVLAHQGRRIGFTIALLLPLVPIVADSLAGPFFTFDPVTPTSPNSRALDLIVWSSLVLSGLMLALCFLRPDAPERASQAQAGSSHPLDRRDGPSPGPV